MGSQISSSAAYFMYKRVLLYIKDIYYTIPQEDVKIKTSRYYFNNFYFQSHLLKLFKGGIIHEKESSIYWHLGFSSNDSFLGKLNF